MSQEKAEHVSAVKKWIIAARPWALPASTMPVIFGTSLAVVIGHVSLDVLGFLLALLGMVVLHSAANMLSDVFDYKRGLDKTVTPVSGAIVRGWLSTRQVTAGSMVLFLIGSIIGLLLVFMTGTILLVVGAVGVVIGLFYTVLKYHALGDLAVFLDFGILGSLGAWIVQTQYFSWLPVLWTVPMAMLVSAILHANNWRDSVSDKERKIVTVAAFLGDKLSLVYYCLLIFGPFIIVLGNILIPRIFVLGLISMPYTFFLTIFAVPNAIKLWKRALQRHNPKKPMDFIILDGATAQHNLIFGLLCTAAVWFQYILKW
jgi:1,4-dihydroxy-2-naphthoate octaprenyltransferase